ncbi:MAG: helix-turn-helix domain-containing protein [Christensenellaceae bacterium]|jgi:transcriptional regulator with XRE-family HTH domain|nr:helix-turn-helix domain-containing protein [Christensenellaceae bacterium]
MDRKSFFAHRNKIMEETVNFSRILRTAMERKGLSQLKFAKLLQIRQSQVSNWLHGKSWPGYYSIRQICIILGMSSDELLELENIKKS